MDAAMHVGVFEAQRMIHRLDDGPRLLRGSRVIEIYQRPAVDLAEQDREVAANGLDVERPKAVGGCMSWRCLCHGVLHLH